MDLYKHFESTFSNQKNVLRQNEEYYEYFNLKPEDGSVRIRLVPFDVYRITMHTYWPEGSSRPKARFKCTGDSEELGRRCLGCYYSNEEVKLAGLSTSSPIIRTIIDFRRIHRVTDAAGNNTVVKCFGKNCYICKEGIPSTMIGRRYWSLGSGHDAALRNANFKIGTRCISCKTGKLESVGLKCKKCGEEVLKDEFEKSPPDVRRALPMRSVECPHCGTIGLPEEVLECSNSCENPRRASIYDTDILVERIRPTSSKSKTTMINVDLSEIDFSYPAEMLLKDPRLKGFELKPYNFESMFPNLSLDLQAGLLKVKNPWNKTKKFIENGSSESGNLVVNAGEESEDSYFSS